MKTIGFIFARGGSKGLPGKNSIQLNGKPLIQYAIELGLRSDKIDQLFVSTEDEQLARIASDLGAEVIVRPAELATDTAPEWLAWKHAVEYVEQKSGEFDVFVSLPATSPLRAIEDVDNALALFKKDNADVCIGITKANRSPYFNMVKFNQEQRLELVNANAGEFSRRQDVPVVYDITTVIYVLNPAFIKSANNLFEGEVIGVEIPKERAVDIDDIYDLKFAEAILDMHKR